MRTTLVMSGMLSLFGACAGTESGDIEWRATGGFSGRGDGSPELRIDRSGHVTRLLEDGSIRTSTLDGPAFHDLQSKIAAAQFSTLDAQYLDNTTDAVIFRVSVPQGGAQYTVEVSDAATVPDALHVVLDTLRGISRSDL